MAANIEVPLYDALCRFARISPARFHVPGHKGGSSFADLTMEARADFEQLLTLDATELPGLDNLHDARGVIARAQALAADTFFAGQTCFLVGGSTLGNLAMILGNIDKGEVVLVQRNCHQSIFHALQMAEAGVVLLDPFLDDRFQVPVGLTLNRLQTALFEVSQAKALVLTYPNYYGMAINLGPLVKEAKQKGLLVLVDEAHGAHFGQASMLPPSAMQMGADVSVQSTHKMLTSMTMTSMLHIQNEHVSSRKCSTYKRLVNTEEMMGWLHRLQSSSPSYPLLASLDLARAQVQSRREKDWQHVLDVYDDWAYSLAKDCGHLLQKSSQPSLNLQQEHEGRDWKQDPLKWIIQAPSGMSGYALQQELAQRHVYVEMADQRQVVLTLGLIPRPKWQEQLHKALADIVRKKEATSVKKDEYEYVSSPGDLLQGSKQYPIQMRMIAHDQKEEVEIQEACGRVAAEMIIPYPPGIPLCIPGEPLSEAHTALIWELRQKGASIQGKSEGKKMKIQVLK